MTWVQMKNYRQVCKGRIDALESHIENLVLEEKRLATLQSNMGKIAKSITNKCIKHINLRDNKIHEITAAGDATIIHIPGVINPSNIFTKELKDGTHFRHLKDSFMVS